MATGVVHSHLWGPDETREAEIARETLTDHHWVTPHLCGLSFLEKPPLYYDLVALAFTATKTISPTVARCVSTLLGLAMLLAVFIFAYRWGGPRRAWLSTFMLLCMPKFFMYSHWILLDIAVGAFCTMALTLLAFLLFWSSDAKRRDYLLYLFYFTCALAFMSKGVIGLFHIVVIVLPFCLLTRNEWLMRQLARPLPLLLFILPVGTWILLYYREGGIGYLHEHFINNTIGRFLHVHFQLANVHFYHTDVGTGEPWFFYIARAFSMFGLALLALPFAIHEGIRGLRARLMSKDPPAQSEADVPLFLILWTLVPGILLSFSSIKETSYILPSYSAVALLVGAWLDRKLPQNENDPWKGVGWLWIIMPISVCSLGAFKMSPRGFMLTSLITLAALFVIFIIQLFRRGIAPSIYLAMAIVLGAIVFTYTPNRVLQTHRCYCPMVPVIWAQVGDAPLYLYKPNDTVRGTFSFFLKRVTPEIDRPADLLTLVSSKRKCFILMKHSAFESVCTDLNVKRHLVRIPLPDFRSIVNDDKESYILATNI